MPSIQDIINAATPGPWKVLDRGWSVGTDTDDICHAPDARFNRNPQACMAYIAMADPTHFALMEAEIQAGRTVISQLIERNTDASAAYNDYRIATAVLDAYREEQNNDA